MVAAPPAVIAEVTLPLDSEGNLDPLLAAQWQMEVSLGFHMFFAAPGIGIPLLMVLAEAMWLRTGLAHYRALARKWAKATALTFAVGANAWMQTPVGL